MTDGKHLDPLQSPKDTVATVSRLKHRWHLSGRPGKMPNGSHHMSPLMRAEVRVERQWARGRDMEHGMMTENGMMTAAGGSAA
jgi:hypothetical protein